jgi:hypothetical protein
MAIRIFALVAISLFSVHGFAAEPAYCNPDNFGKFEQEVAAEGARRLHVYQVGQLTLVGLGIGTTPVAITMSLANQLGGVGSDKNYCTWYLNDGNDDAAKMFTHRYVPRPWFWDSKKKIVNKYVTRLKSSFADDPINMVECAVDQGYLAVGCDGMKHRGPSVFAMFLAYSGCEPKHAAAIANQIWGLDTVPENMRLGIAKAGYQLGNQNPAARQALQAVMSSK